MKINLAVYTAQEGYSWQPGTVFQDEELAEFKKRIGKFPSPDAVDFPFGGVFLIGDRVVFYRYHVAKKIDFRGRDALYCVLGAVEKAKASLVDPKALFACPEFAIPAKPFPTTLELSEAAADAVPEWLKNLDRMTLDVRFAGPADEPNYENCEINQVLIAPSPTSVPKDEDKPEPLRHQEEPQQRIEEEKAPPVAQPPDSTRPSIKPASTVSGLGSVLISRNVRNAPRWTLVAMATLTVLLVVMTAFATVLLWQVMNNKPTSNDELAEQQCEMAKMPRDANKQLEDKPPAEKPTQEKVKDKGSLGAEGTGPQQVTPASPKTEDVVPPPEAKSGVSAKSVVMDKASKLGVGNPENKN